ncbi:hypothetical protein IV38_GL001384 [Lactobacillus selangorensis]|uniref:HTH cro/C1-type domain-containing protein n=1 Tax=Lactobacillus selangorensis TaxID=81857 RepID=A0A0R2FIM0_9LACO|nr:helix-turn-helix transcriptional regulator [Lactobacillus selangorensis]KRN28384.1 hypothetical protein IV38_GL001384 [Lactobacillus selangorensis]KRN31885.1 hypothetical protein IV40_GL001171 [Lactobacillus selangorensis]
MDFGTQVRSARQNKRMTMAELSQVVANNYHIKINQGVISRIEHNYNVSNNQLFAVADYLNIDLNRTTAYFRSGFRFRSR